MFHVNVGSSRIYEVYLDWFVCGVYFPLGFGFISQREGLRVGGFHFPNGCCYVCFCNGWPRRFLCLDNEAKTPRSIRIWMFEVRVRSYFWVHMSSLSIKTHLKSCYIRNVKHYLRKNDVTKCARNCKVAILR